MTSPSSSNQIDAGIAPEALRSLRRGLERAHGFALFVAVIKTPVQCGALITLLREAAPKLHLHTVTLPADTTDILDEVLRQTAPDLRGPVMIVGLDAALPSDATDHPLLQALNLRRPEWPRLVQQPVVLWVPEYLYQLLARAVPDFLDGRSDTLHVPDLEPTQFQALYSNTWDGGLDNRMPVAARMERIRELESRVATNEASRDPVIRATVGDWLNELGLHLQLLGRVQESLAHFKKALVIARDIGDRRREGIALGNLGDAYRSLGEARKAIEFHEQALAIARENADLSGEATALSRIGQAHEELRDPQQAIVVLEKALTILRTTVRTVGDRRREARTLCHLGSAYYLASDTDKALLFCNESLTIARQIGDRRYEDVALGWKGMIHRTLGQPKLAIVCFQEQLDISRQIGHRRGESYALGNLGLAYADLGDVRKAVAFHEQHLAIAREIGDRRGEGNALWNSALALDKLGQWPEVMTRAEAALKTYEQIEHPHAAKVRAQLAKWRSAPVSGAET